MLARRLVTPTPTARTTDRPAPAQVARRLARREALRPLAALLLALALLAAGVQPSGAADAPNSGLLTVSDGRVGVSTQTVSPEAIERLYRGILGRGPDDAGSQYWQHAGLPLEALATEFIVSEEFVTRFGSSNDAIIANLYRNVLEREADAGGLAYWRAEVNRAPMANIVVGFTESAEFRATHPGPAHATSELRWSDQLTEDDARAMASRFFSGVRLDQAMVIMQCESNLHTTQVATNRHGSFSSYDIGLMQINNYYNSEEIDAAFAAAPPDIAAVINTLGGDDEALLHPLVNLYAARWIVDHSDWRLNGSSGVRNQRWGAWTCANRLDPAEYWR